MRSLTIFSSTDEIFAFERPGVTRVFELGVNLLGELELRDRHLAIDDFEIRVGAFRTHVTDFVVLHSHEGILEIY